MTISERKHKASVRTAFGFRFAPVKRTNNTSKLRTHSYILSFFPSLVLASLSVSSWVLQQRGLTLPTWARCFPARKYSTDWMHTPRTAPPAGKPTEVWHLALHTYCCGGGVVMDVVVCCLQEGLVLLFFCVPAERQRRSYGIFPIFPKQYVAMMTRLSARFKVPCSVEHIIAVTAS